MLQSIDYPVVYNRDLGETDNEVGKIQIIAATMSEENRGTTNFRKGEKLNVKL